MDRYYTVNSSQRLAIEIVIFLDSLLILVDVSAIKKDCNYEEFPKGNSILGKLSWKWVPKTITEGSMILYKMTMTICSSLCFVPFLLESK